jgi:probable phosphoglycerate mutase
VLILVRHGESVANAAGLLLGRTDVELTETGRAQVAAARRLLTEPVTEVRTSPLRRARDTADLLALGPAPTIDERWIEVDYGEFECRPLGDIPAEVWQRWRADRHFRPEGGETLAEVDERVAGACAELFAPDGPARRRDEDVVVVSHVTPIKAAVAWALGTPDLYWRLHLRTASVTRIGWNRDAPILHGFNEVALALSAAPTPQSPGA